MYSAAVEEKKAILLSKAPFSARMREIKASLDLLDFACTNVKLDGSRLTKSGVGRILGGEIIEHIPIKEHMLINAHRAVFDYFRECLSMKMDVDSKLVCTVFSTLTGISPPQFREDSEPIYHLDFVPAAYASMSAAIGEELLCVRRMDVGGDYILKAAMIHRAVVKTYPFSEKTEMVARSVMQYELMKSGLYPISLEISETEYNMAAAESIGGSHDAFAKIVEGAAVSKTEKLTEIVLGS